MKILRDRKNGENVVYVCIENKINIILIIELIIIGKFKINIKIFYNWIFKIVF